MAKKQKTYWAAYQPDGKVCTSRYEGYRSPVLANTRQELRDAGFYIIRKVKIVEIKP